VFEETIRWSDGNPFFSCLELSFYVAVSSSFVLPGAAIANKPNYVENQK